MSLVQNSDGTIRKVTFPNEVPFRGAKKLNDLSDVLSTSPTNDQVLAWNAANSRYENKTFPGGGATNFLGLSDSPSDYTGQGTKKVKVNSAANALEFISDSFISMIDTPANYTSAASKKVKVNSGGNALEFANDTFLTINDTPSDYTSKAGFLVKVNSTANGIAFESDVESLDFILPETDSNIKDTINSVVTGGGNTTVSQAFYDNCQTGDYVRFVPLLQTGFPKILGPSNIEDAFLIKTATNRQVKFTATRQGALVGSATIPFDSGGTDVTLMNCQIKVSSTDNNKIKYFVFENLNTLEEWRSTSILLPVISSVADGFTISISLVDLRRKLAAPDRRQFNSGFRIIIPEGDYSGVVRLLPNIYHHSDSVFGSGGTEYGDGSYEFLVPPYTNVSGDESSYLPKPDFIKLKLDKPNNRWVPYNINLNYYNE